MSTLFTDWPEYFVLTLKRPTFCKNSFIVKVTGRLLLLFYRQQDLDGNREKKVVINEGTLYSSRVIVEGLIRPLFDKVKVSTI